MLCVVVLILKNVECVDVQSFVTYGVLLVCVVGAGFFLAVVNGLLSLCNFHFLRG